jgi:hypothetical protein
VNRYLLIRRLRGPAVLLLIGTLALLDQMGVIEHFWHLFWPLLFILMGVILLAERAILSIDGPGVPPYPGSPYSGPPYSGTPYPGSPYPGTPYPGAPYTGTPAAQSPATPATAIVPAHDHDFDDHNGGQQ